MKGTSYPEKVVGDNTDHKLNPLCLKLTTMVTTPTTGQLLTYKMNRADGTPIKYHFWQRIKIRCYCIKASLWLYKSLS